MDATDKKLLKWALKRLAMELRDRGQHFDLQRDGGLAGDEVGAVGLALNNRRRKPMKAFGSWSFADYDVVSYLRAKLTED